MNYCKNCGTPLKENAKFCTSCGTPVPGRKKIKPWITAICAGVAAAVIIAVIAVNLNAVTVKPPEYSTVAAGQLHSLAITPGGTTIAAGFNDDGQCNVSDWENIVSLTASEVGSAGLSADGTVYTAGEMDFPEVYDWKNITYITASGEGDYLAGLTKDGRVLVTDSEYVEQYMTEDWKNIVNIELCWMGCIYGVDKNGKVYAAGMNEYGQCEVDDWNNIVEVAAGSRHVIGLTKNGTVMGAGYDEYDQLDVDDWENIIQVDAFGDNSYGLREDGTVVAAGDNSYGQCNVSSWKNVVKITAGANTVFGITESGDVLTAGDNEYGQLNIEHNSPVTEISSLFTTLIREENGDVRATGFNNYSQCNLEIITAEDNEYYYETEEAYYSNKEDPNQIYFNQTNTNDSTNNFFQTKADPNIVKTSYNNTLINPCENIEKFGSDTVDHESHISNIRLPEFTEDNRAADDLNTKIWEQYGSYVSELEQGLPTNYWVDISYDVNVDGSKLIVTVYERFSKCTSYYSDYEDVYVYDTETGDYEIHMDGNGSW